MPVAEILKSKGAEVFSIAPDRILTQACAELDRRKVGALIVGDAEEVVGVWSIGDGRAPDRRTAAEAQNPRTYIAAG